MFCEENVYHSIIVKTITFIYNISFKLYNIYWNRSFM